jgi:hypothetical protein
MPAAWAAGAAAVGSVAGAYISSQGQQNAAQTQANAALQQQGNLLAAGQTASQQFTPYANYGATPLSSLTANNPYFNQQFSNQDLNAQLAPNYAFQLQQGQAGQNAASNATGGFVGGNAQQALSQFTQNYAQNAYQNAFTNFTNQKNAIAGIDLANAGLGLQGATGSANAQLGTATNVAQIGLGAANAQAASQIAQGNIAGNTANALGSIGYGYANQMNNQNLNNQNLGGYTPSEIAQGASPGGAFTPTVGNSFIVNPA